MRDEGRDQADAIEAMSWQAFGAFEAVIGRGWDPVGFGVVGRRARMRSRSVSVNREGRVSVL
jgi:hypothetical protein